MEREIGKRTRELSMVSVLVGKRGSRDRGKGKLLCSDVGELMAIELENHHPKVSSEWLILRIVS